MKEELKFKISDNGINEIFKINAAYLDLSNEDKKEVLDTLCEWIKTEYRGKGKRNYIIKKTQ